MCIHICLITSARVFEAQYGGESRFTRSLASWLAIHGYPITLIGSTFSGVRSKYMYSEKCSCVSSSGTPEKPKAIYPPYFVYAGSRFIITLKALVKIIRIHREKRLAIIHAQDTGYSGLAAILASKLAHLPVVISSHGIRHLTLASQNKGTFNQILLKFEYKLDLFCVSKADGLIAVNPFIKGYYEERVPELSCKLYFLPIPIKVSNFEFNSRYRTEIRNEFGICNESILVGFVGRLVGVKNVNSLLIAFSEVVQKLRGISLLVVGTGAEETSLKNLAKAKGLEDNVIFLGIRKDIDKILSALDIFVLPSFTEGLSTSLLEAMASGRAVICSDISANRELVKHGENGVLINPNKYSEIREAIFQLAKNDEMRIRMGKAAIQTAKKYDEEIIFPLIEEYYKKILENYKKI